MKPDDGLNCHGGDLSGMSPALPSTNVVKSDSQHIEVIRRKWIENDQIGSRLESSTTPGDGSMKSAKEVTPDLNHRRGALRCLIS